MFGIFKILILSIKNINKLNNIKFLKLGSLKEVSIEVVLNTLSITRELYFNNVTNDN